MISYISEHVQRSAAAGAKKRGGIEQRLLRRWGGERGLGEWTMSSGGGGSGAHLGRVSV